ncbi:hypothetical protein OT109_07360 [Phycisphaeraceae bacterium D3-23]
MTSKLLAASCALGLFAATTPAQAQEGDGQIEFEIVDGRVVPSEDFAVMVSVLGAAITSSGDDIPVTAMVHLGDDTLEPWGPYASPTNGDVNDHGAVRHYIVDEVFDADDGINITVSGRSWVKKKSWYSGVYDSHWRTHLSANSHDEGWQVKVLRDGDDAPDIDGFENQSDAEEFVGAYIDYDTGKMTMDENQAIYLFEIGTTNVSSSAADFQDLVVLVTLGEAPEDFYADTEPQSLYD